MPNDEAARPVDAGSRRRATLGVVIVSFNTKALLDRCLVSLKPELERAGFSGTSTIWVVDNASDDGSPGMVRERHPDVRLAELPANVGFTAANNVVLGPWAGGKASGVDVGPCPDYVLLLNPDTEMRQGAVAALVAALAADPLAAVAGPRLVYPDGRPQTSAFRLPGVLQTALDLWPVPRLMESPLNGRYPAGRFRSGAVVAVEATLGACMMVRRAALQHVGPLDEGFFMYCEELDWCRRFGDAGYKVLCVPAAVVVHHGGASTGQPAFSASSFAHLWRSRRRYFAKHAPAWRRLVVDGLMRLEFGRRSALDRRAVKQGWLLPEERDERAKAYAAVWAKSAATSDMALRAPGPELIASETASGRKPLAEPNKRSASSVTAVVLALNEEAYLADCLASLRWCGRVVVVDSGSTDGTADVARRAGAEVLVHTFENYSRQRQFALGEATTPWLLFVDADERVPPALVEEIVYAIASAADDVAGYWLPRENDFWRHRMRGGGWWPDYQLRLLRPGLARYDPERAVHEVAVVTGRTEKLSVPLVHLNYASFAEFRAKQSEYARHEADKRRAAGVVVRPHNLVLQPWREFWRRFVALEGWRDGLVGLVACGWLGWTEAVVLSKLVRSSVTPLPINP